LAALEYMHTIMADGLVDVEVCEWCAKEIMAARKCGGCERVFYCDEECQEADWKTHKKNCEGTFLGRGNTRRREAPPANMPYVDITLDMLTSP